MHSADGIMNILLTNDDGISAAGINALFSVLSEKHSVYIIAPHEERSACSNAITVRDIIKTDIIDDRRYSVTGYPADCVNIGLHGNLIPEIDMVISGINHGPNLGEDVYFSGTVAGARSAYIFGVQGIAVSLDCIKRSDYFYDAARFIMRFIDDFRTAYGRHPVCLNINYPDIPVPEIMGVRYVCLGTRHYNDSYCIISESQGQLLLRLDGTVESIDKEGSDITELRKNYITITPLSLDHTDYDLIEKMKVSL
jgi:5'-nucleotidase